MTVRSVDLGIVTVRSVDLGIMTVRSVDLGIMTVRSSLRSGTPHRLGVIPLLTEPLLRSPGTSLCQRVYKGITPSLCVVLQFEIDLPVDGFKKLSILKRIR